MIIYLGVSLPKPSSDLPESGPGRSLLSVWSCSGWGLHSPSRYRDGGSLLHCHSTLTRRGLLRKTSEDCLQSSGHIAYNPSGRYYFCCTGLGVTSTGRYPASCPVKPGLSSSERMSAAIVCLTCCHTYCNLFFPFCPCNGKFLFIYSTVFTYFL